MHGENGEDLVKHRDFLIELLRFTFNSTHPFMQRDANLRNIGRGSVKEAADGGVKIYRFITATRFVSLCFEDRRMLLTEAVYKK